MIGRVVSPVQRELYRRTGGRLSLTGSAPVLLLTTVGRRTGLERTVPLLYLREDGRLVVCNVNPGSERTNPWVLNLRAQPHARVQLRRETFPVGASEATPEELDRYWPHLTKLCIATSNRRSFWLEVLIWLSSTSTQPVSPAEPVGDVPLALCERSMRLSIATAAFAAGSDSADPGEATNAAAATAEMAAAARILVELCICAP